jgi:biopolymer transport protein TolQ
MNAVNLILQTGVVAKGVLVLLLFFSLACWTIIFLKLRVFRRADRQDERFLRLFREGRSLNNVYEDCRRFSHSPLAALFREGYREIGSAVKGNPSGTAPAASPDPQPKGQEALAGELLSRLSRVLRHASLREMSALERMLIFLATTGNVTPFIGLFGTVWGIMDAFHSIGMTGSANLGAVAPGHGDPRGHRLQLFPQPHQGGGHPDGSVRAGVHRDGGTGCLTDGAVGALAADERFGRDLRWASEVDGW